MPAVPKRTNSRNVAARRMRLVVTASTALASVKTASTVLYVFSILLTSSEGDKAEKLRGYKFVVGILATLAGLAICLFVTLRHQFLPEHFEHGELAVREIGFALMSPEKQGYLLPFEVISLLLLACIVGGILIARKR